MELNTYLWVVIETNNLERFYLRCRGLGINVLATRVHSKGVEIKVLEQDYVKLKKIWFIKCYKKNIEGYRSWWQKIWNHRVFLISFLIGFLFLIFLSHVIVSVNVIHTNKEIRDLVTNALEEKGIKKNTLKKNYKELEQIKSEILHAYPDKLEWLEIETKGMTYIVRIEERKIENKDLEKTSCNVVARKDGIVKKIIYSKGETYVHENDAVKKGDILISGIIKKDEEEKMVVCATGSVYAEVWYEVTVNVPMKTMIRKDTGKTRFNIKLKNNAYHDFLFKSRLDHYREEKKPLLTLFGTEISFVKQIEVQESEYHYTEEEALNFALEEANQKLLDKLNDDEEIIMKKVLKKTVNNSTMNVEIFAVVLESIGEQQEFVKE